MEPRHNVNVEKQCDKQCSLFSEVKLIDYFGKIVQEKCGEQGASSLLSLSMNGLR